MNTSIIGRAITGGYLSVEAINIRDYAFNKHQKVDDYPYGGGAGMLRQPNLQASSNPRENDRS